ncbi:hypothetical protein ARMGADRAFT_101812 [Armillaria gallica]|uniref:Ig-like domain-containing protein n=1 Tax=Armillaria gallica TaxID=47427 RepID=A0A2H3C9W3_ARMGA|nr:hypothetical protein ARMGADRAFT_101812 [Armillaria gallica]
MLEARDACSVAIARNGGHITPLRHHDHLDLKKKPGAEAAKQIIRWFDRAKEKLGRYLEELPGKKGGWGTMEGPVEMQLADGSSRRQAGRYIHIGSSRRDPVKAAQDVLVFPAVHSHTSTTPPAAIFTPNTSILLTDGCPTSLPRCGKRSFPCEAIWRHSALEWAWTRDGSVRARLCCTQAHLSNDGTISPSSLGEKSHAESTCWA